jgi:hypothetical protein
MKHVHAVRVRISQIAYSVLAWDMFFSYRIMTSYLLVISEKTTANLKGSSYSVNCVCVYMCVCVGGGGSIGRQISVEICLN